MGWKDVECVNDLPASILRMGISTSVESDVDIEDVVKVNDRDDTLLFG